MDNSLVGLKKIYILNGNKYNYIYGNDHCISVLKDKILRNKLDLSVSDRIPNIVQSPKYEDLRRILELMKCNVGKILARDKILESSDMVILYLGIGNERDYSFINKNLAQRIEEYVLKQKNLFVKIITNTKNFLNSKHINVVWRNLNLISSVIIDFYRDIYDLHVNKKILLNNLIIHNYNYKNMDTPRSKEIITPKKPTKKKLMRPIYDIDKVKRKLIFVKK